MVRRRHAPTPRPVVEAGLWDRIFDAVSVAYDGDLQMIDSSSIRVHQHAANGKWEDVIEKEPRGDERLPWEPTSRPMHWALASWTDDEDPCPTGKTSAPSADSSIIAVISSYASSAKPALQSGGHPLRRTRCQLPRAL